VLIARERRAIDDRGRGRGDVARYEQLRGQALAGAPAGSRLGLALLQHRGVSAWTRAWQTTAPGPTVSATLATRASAPVAEGEIVSVLASMALACAAAA
jgi:biotin-(acetyl-CoA carboxylase) ligase